MFPGLSIEWRGQDLNLRPSGYETVETVFEKWRVTRGFSYFPSSGGVFSGARPPLCSLMLPFVYGCIVACVLPGMRRRSSRPQAGELP